MERLLIEQNLLEAIRRDDLVAVLVSIKEGASIHTKDESGNDVVLLAAKHGHWMIVYALLRCGANVEAQCNGTGNRLIHFAAGSGNWEAICELFRSKASFSSQNKYGETALDLAIKHSHQRVVDLLIENGGTANTERHYIRKQLLAAAKARELQLYAEEFECVCGHGLSKHTSSRGVCNGIVYLSDGYDYEMCTCDMFADILDRGVPSRTFHYRKYFGDYDLEE
jgi:hypothetical protein